MKSEAYTGPDRLSVLALMRDLLATASAADVVDVVAEWTNEHIERATATVALFAHGSGELGDAPQAGPATVKSGGVANIPIRTRTGVVGTLDVTVPDARDMTLGLLRTAEAIAEMLSVNLERLRLQDLTIDQRDRSRADAERMQRLTQLAVELSGINNESEVFSLVAAELAETGPSNRVSLAAPIPGTPFLRVQRHTEDDTQTTLETGTKVPIEGSITGEVLRTGRAAFFPDISQTGYYEHERLAAAGFRSAVSVPIPVNGEVGAILNSASFDRYALDNDHVNAIEALAGLAGANLERIRARSDAESTADQLNTLIDDSPLLIMTIADDGRILRMSRYASSRLGHDSADLEERSVATLYVADDRKQAVAEIEALIAAPAGTVSTWLARITDEAGSEAWLRHTGRRLADTNTDDAELLIVCEDVTELHELGLQLEHQATHDPLTGLVNRREFDRRLVEAIDHTEGDVSLCFIDVDRFKLINDTAGHHAGDELLVDIATVLQELVLPHDTLARIGGDEFALILTDCPLPDAVSTAERLRQRVNGVARTFEGRAFPLSLSIGVACHRPGHDVDVLVTDADLACYAAKNSGRNRVSVATPEQTERRRDGAWVQRVQDALANGDLRLAAQEIAPLEPVDDRRSFEVLVRLSDGEDLVPAGVFIPPTERYGLITDVDRWVVTELIDKLSSNLAAASQIGYCSINLSARSVENTDFQEFLIDLIGQRRVPPEMLVFEITEMTALSQFHVAVQFIEAVTALGCRFALDDFGAGFSTFRSLKQLPVHILKIDGSIVRDITVDPIDREIVHAMTQVAESIGLETVAEFVEDDEACSVLAELGVDYAQGWGIGKPRPIEEMLAELAATSRTSATTPTVLPASPATPVSPADAVSPAPAIV